MWEIPTPAIFKMQDINAPAKRFVCRQRYTHDRTAFFASL